MPKKQKTQKRKSNKRAAKKRTPRVSMQPSMFSKAPPLPPRPRRPDGAMMTVAKLSASLANPFDQTECIPDGATGVGCFSTKELFMQSTVAAGSSTMIAVCPRVYANYYQYTASNTATPTVTVGGTWTACTASASIGTQFSKFRTISAGVRCSYIGNTVNDAGIALVGLVSGQTPLSTFNGVTLSVAASFCMNYKVIPLRNGAVATWRPVEFDHMSEWDATLAPAAILLTGTQLVPYIVIITYASNPSIGIFQVEVVCNYEGQYNNQIFMPGGINSVPTVPPVPGWYETVQSIASKVEPLMPLVGATVEGVRSGGLMGAVRAVANGIAYPLANSRSGLPRQLN